MGLIKLIKTQLNRTKCVLSIMKKILLIEDQTLVRKSLVALINTSNRYDVSHSTETIAGALKLLNNKVAFDLILCDYSLKGETALDFLRAMNASFKVPVILLTSFFNARYLHECINHGAKGFLFKESDADELEEAFDTVLSGATFFKIVESVSSHPHSLLEGSEKNGKVPILTPKESEILKWLATGMSNKEIAKVLGKSDQTVKAQVQELLRKLDVSSRTEAVTKATKLNMV